MLRSLFFKLVGAFALIILVLAVVATLLANRATTGQFRLYSDRNGQLWAQRLAPTLAAYYESAGSWQGIDNALAAPTGNMGGWWMEGDMMMEGGMMMDGTMMGGNDPMGRSGITGGSSADVWAMMGQRLILVDAEGRVLRDSAGELMGATLSQDQLAVGAPIRAKGQQVGSVLVVASASTLPATPAGEFLSGVNHSLVLAVLAAGAIALVLGGLLFFQITAPIRRLTAAASGIAAGDLSQRVETHSQDELGQLAQTFNRMADSLAQAEAQRRQLVADVAHELRTPISVLQANLEGIQDGVLPLDAEQVASLYEETTHLSRLVADLHLLSLAEAGQLKLERTELDLARLIGKITARLKPKAAEKGIALRVELHAAPLPPVVVDADRITQVIANLVENALRHTPAGGEILVHAGVRGDEKAAGRSPRGQQPAIVLVSVSDTGGGISAEALPHIFDRFYRVDESRTRISGGSGLGLAIVRHLVETHGGQVWAESPLGRLPNGLDYGTRISFTLPVLQEVLTV